MKMHELLEDLARDLRKARRARAQAAAGAKLVRLNKDGSESKMNDATSHYEDEEKAIIAHRYQVSINPGKVIQHHLYAKMIGDKVMKVKLVNGEVVGTA